MNFKEKKVLVMGLGLLGGGVATAQWLVKHGAKVTVTDLRREKELLPSIRALGEAAKKITLVLGKHRAADFRTHDLIVVNPAVPRESKFLKIARAAHKDIVNDARIFFDRIQNPTLAVTGTRGKTTTANWIAHLLRARDRAVAAAGNTPARPLLADLDRLTRRPDTPAVLELSSWQLEFLPEARKAPDIAVITNLYPDHLNRYRGMEDYAHAKAGIFVRQLPSQSLILNADNAWTKTFLKSRPRGRIYLFSTKTFPKGTRGLFIRNGEVIFSESGVMECVAREPFAREFKNAWGSHNLENLLAAMLAARLMGMPWPALITRVKNLPGIPYREEIIIRKKRLIVVNDSAGTSPDATVAALRRFSGRNTYLITGGTDKKLEFRELALVMKKTTRPEHVYFLNGSATTKLLRELSRMEFFKKRPPQIFENLRDILLAISQQLPIIPMAKPSKILDADKVEHSRQGRNKVGTDYRLPITVLFSPGAASFEKFKNEFDRGAQFTREARRFFARQ